MTTSHHLQVSYQAIRTLKPYANNARVHSKKQIRQIADSIRQFGFTNPILLDGDNSIIAGHGRVEAAKILGINEVPTILLSHLTESQKRAYIIADNRLAELAGWDKTILAIEFQHLGEITPEIDLTITGFEMGEIDLMIQGLDEENMLDSEDNLPLLPASPISQNGDLWQLGDHRLYCGNSLEMVSYETLLEKELARIIFTDPPYNVPIQGHVSGLGKVVHTEFAMASGEMTSAQFTEFLQQVCLHMKNYSLPGSLHYICMDWRHIPELTLAGTTVYERIRQLCVWNKNRGGMGSMYRSKHELVFVFKHGREPHINNVALGKHGRYRTNVWDYPAVNSFTTGQGSELAMHPTVKPVRMIADAIMDATNRGDIVLDPFGGSGSTLLAAERTGRCARLIEFEPKYVDVTIERWQRQTKCHAVHLHSGQTFTERNSHVQLGKER